MRTKCEYAGVWWGLHMGARVTSSPNPFSKVWNSVKIKFGEIYKLVKFRLKREVSTRIPLQNILRKGDPITSYLCSGGLIRGAYHNILKFNYNLYSSSLDFYQKRCVLYKLLISLRCMNESPTVAACVSTGSRRCVYKSFSLSRFILILGVCY